MGVGGVVVNEAVLLPGFSCWVRLCEVGPVEVSSQAGPGQAPQLSPPTVAGLEGLPSHGLL
jgi:hypothetical protein